MQRLADIDVAEARDQPLVEQRRLQGRSLACEESGEKLPVQLVAERLDPDAPEQRMRGEARRAAISAMKPKRRASL